MTHVAVADAVHVGGEACASELEKKATKDAAEKIIFKTYLEAVEG